MTARILLQLAFVYSAEASAIYDPHKHVWERLSKESVAEYDRLTAQADECARQAAALGLKGGTDAAFDAELPPVVAYCPKSERLEAARCAVEDQWMGERIA